VEGREGGREGERARARARAREKESQRDRERKREREREGERLSERRDGATMPREVVGRDTLNSSPKPLNPNPYARSPALGTIHPTPDALCPAPCTLHPTPYALHNKPYTLEEEALCRRSGSGGASDNVSGGRSLFRTGCMEPPEGAWPPNAYRGKTV